MRFMMVESQREIEAEVKSLEKRLDARKRQAADAEGRLLLENSWRVEPGARKPYDNEICEALSESVNQILNGVKLVLENTPPELSADIVERGSVLAGGDFAQRFA